MKLIQQGVRIEVHCQVNFMLRIFILIKIMMNIAELCSYPILLALLALASMSEEREVAIIGQ